MPEDEGGGEAALLGQIVDKGLAGGGVEVEHEVVLEDVLEDVLEEEGRGEWVFCEGLQLVEDVVEVVHGVEDDVEVVQEELDVEVLQEELEVEVLHGIEVEVEVEVLQEELEVDVVQGVAVFDEHDEHEEHVEFAVTVMLL